MKDLVQQLLAVREVRLRKAGQDAKRARADVAQREVEHVRIERVAAALMQTRDTAEHDAIATLCQAPVPVSELLRHRTHAIWFAEQQAKLAQACADAEQSLAQARSRHAHTVAVQRERRRCKEKATTLHELERSREEQLAQRAEEEAIDEWVSTKRESR